MLRQHRHFHHKPGLSPTRHLVNTKKQAAGPIVMYGPNNRTGGGAGTSNVVEYVECSECWLCLLPVLVRVLSSSVYLLLPLVSYLLHACVCGGGHLLAMFCAREACVGEFTQEYALALLLNLSLCSSGKTRSVELKRTLLPLLQACLQPQLHWLRNYIHGALLVKRYCVGDVVNEHEESFNCVWRLARASSSIPSSCAS